MEKENIINKILKFNPGLAWNFKGEFIGYEGYISNNDYRMPYRKYVINNSKYLGIDGGPSPVDLWDYDYCWNIQTLKKTNNNELKTLLGDIKSQDLFYKTLYERYSKPMTIVEFFNSMEIK